MSTQRIDLATIQKRIAHGGKLLGLACKIAQITLIASIVVNIGLLIAVFFSPDAQSIAHEIYEDNAIFQTLSHFIDQSGIKPLHVAAIGCFIAIITPASLLPFIGLARQLFGYLAAGNRPFNLEAARKMRRYSWFMLLFMFYNIPLGLISFGLTMLFSYIMEYGGYIQEQADETNRIQEEMIVSFAEITENKSGQTGQHIRRVSEYARIIATQLGLPQEAVENLRIASTMHDVGKILIPSEILEKPGKLTDEEYATIKTHTTLGGKLLQNVEGEEMLLSRTIALQHHERYDGKGYPSNLSSEQISLEGRIVAVADVYDALTSKRSYKDAWKEEDAYQEIVKGRGTQFDPRVVDAFVAAHDQILEVQEKFKG